MNSRNANNFKAIDISEFQQGLDFSKVIAAGITVVYIKATQGTGYINPSLRQHYQEAKSHGLNVGFYHYFSPGIDAVTQAQFFNTAISGMSYECLPMLDVEEDKGYDAEALSNVVHVCLNEITYLTGHRAVIYTYTSFARNSLKASYVNMYPLWAADYSSKGYPGENGIWDSWVGYQYSDSGNIGGITVDLDEFTGDIFIDKADYDAAVDRLAAKGIIGSPDYWKTSVSENTEIQGEWMGIIIERLSGKSTVADAIEKLTALGVIGSPDYWGTNCMPGKTVAPVFVKILIINAVRKLGI